jgi:methylmalonyl-CoA/ethylmalonyl-CoA epimerase
MNLGRLNHIGVAVPSIEQAVAHYRTVLGARDITEPFDMIEQGVKVCFVNTPANDEPGGGTQIELIEPLDDTSPIAGFLQKNPLGGQHHLCFEVPDIAAARAWFEGQGKRILGPTRIGAHGTPIFFVHPKDMLGQLTEIMETPCGH